MAQTQPIDALSPKPGSTTLAWTGASHAGRDLGLPISRGQAPLLATQAPWNHQENQS